MKQLQSQSNFEERKLCVFPKIKDPAYKHHFWLEPFHPLHHFLNLSARTAIGDEFWSRFRLGMWNQGHWISLVVICLSSSAGFLKWWIPKSPWVSIPNWVPPFFVGNLYLPSLLYLFPFKNLGYWSQKHSQQLPPWQGKRTAVWLTHSSDHQSVLACIHQVAFGYVTSLVWISMVCDHVFVCHIYICIYTHMYRVYRPAKFYP